MFGRPPGDYTLDVRCALKGEGEERSKTWVLPVTATSCWLDPLITAPCDPRPIAAIALALTSFTRG